MQMNWSSSEFIGDWGNWLCLSWAYLFFRAGYKLTVIDSSDKDWWKGKCFGAVGVFPSTYVAKLAPREKPLQVIQSVNINSLHADGIIKLLRDQVRIFTYIFLMIPNVTFFWLFFQIVIQVGMDGYHCRDGSILIRTAEHRQGHCPIQYLQEV